MLLPRRGFLLGLGAMLCAPAIVRVESIMPVRAIVQPYCIHIWKIVNPDGSVEFLTREMLMNSPNTFPKIMNAEQVWL